jgi:dienelactone hydrolase
VTDLRSSANAQVRALVVVAAIARVPGVARVLGWVTAKPVVAEHELAGVPTSLYRAGRDRHRPALVFLNGVTARGRQHPDVRRLAEALARAGFLVAVPDPTGLAQGRIDGDTLGSSIAVIRAVADRPDVRAGRVGLVGVSIGATLALVAAEEKQLSDRVSVVASIAPFADFVNAIRLATTGHALAEGVLVPFQPVGFLGLVVARSLVAALPASASRSELAGELERVPDDAPDPLAQFRAPRPDLDDADARALVALLANRDPAHFAALYQTLPTELRAGIARLSPLQRATALRAPVELAIAASDTYLPLAEAQALVSAASGTRVQLTVTAALDHADARLSWRALPDTLRLYGWMVRTITAARRP